MDNKGEKKPQSLFGDNDIRYSVDTVDERWGREMTRRKRLAAKIVIPILLIVIGGGLGLARAYHVFPFQLPPPPPQNYEEEAAQEMAKQKDPVEKLGYEKAEFQIHVICDNVKNDLPEKLLAILHEATDLKPSQIYVEIWNKEDAPMDFKGLLPPDAKLFFFMNGSPMFETPDTEEKLLKLVNDHYSYKYKYDKLLINPETYGVKAPTEEEMQIRTEKRLEREKEANLTLPSLKFERK